MDYLNLVHIFCYFDSENKNPIVIFGRYDIKSTETLFDNATRSRIVSLESSTFELVLCCLFCFAH